MNKLRINRYIVVIFGAFLCSCYQQRSPSELLTKIPKGNHPYIGSIMYSPWTCKDVDKDYVYLLYQYGDGAVIRSESIKVPTKDAVILGSVKHNSVNIKYLEPKVIISVDYEYYSRMLGKDEIPVK